MVAASLESAFMRNLWEQFVQERILLEKGDPNALGLLRRTSKFFQRLDKDQSGDSPLIEEAYFSRYEGSLLRANLIANRFISEKCGFTQHEKYRLEARLRKRCDEILDRISGMPWELAIRKYYHHMNNKTLSLRTRTFYLTVAHDFSEYVKFNSFSAWSKSLQDDYFLKFPGNRTSLGVFIRFCHENLDVAVGMPHGMSLVQKNDRAVSRIRILVEKLKHASRESASKLLLEVLSLSLGIPKKKIFALRESGEFKMDKECIRIQGEEVIRKESPLYEYAERWLSI